MNQRLLIVDNDDGLVHFLARLFACDGYEVASSTDGEAALGRLGLEPFDAVLLSYRLPGIDGLEVLSRIKTLGLKTPVIVMAAEGTTETAIEAMKRGAYDYLSKPFDTEELKRIVGEATEVSRLMKGVISLAPAAAPVPAPRRPELRIVGNHRAMQEVFKLVGQVAEKDVTVLITGETGTGKELVARAIYHHSRRREAPFMAVNCAAMSETLLESELFGHERGAFTGADRPHRGWFERCDGGTLFFDEIGDMPPAAQAKVLRVLQEGKFERLGGSETIATDVRLLAATNKDLDEEAKAGRFRRDLYYRLRVMTIELPPLRERIDDIPALVEHFIRRLADEYGKAVRYISDEAIRKLKAYSWPGNVRQLENCLRRAMVVARGDVLLADHIALAADGSATGAPAAGKQTDDRIRSLVEELFPLVEPGVHANVLDLVEKAIIAHALAVCRNNQVHAARLLGISRNTLRHRIGKYGLDAPGR